MPSIEKRVQRGIARLDDAFGSRKWVSSINLSTLNMADGNRCILGQVYRHLRDGDNGGWDAGVEVLYGVENGGADEPEGGAYDKLVSRDGFADFDGVFYCHQLDYAWTQALKKMRSEDTPEAMTGVVAPAALPEHVYATLLHLVEDSTTRVPGAVFQDAATARRIAGALNNQYTGVGLYIAVEATVTYEAL